MAALDVNLHYALACTESFDLIYQLENSNGNLLVIQEESEVMVEKQIIQYCMSTEALLAMPLCAYVSSEKLVLHTWKTRKVRTY